MIIQKIKFVSVELKFVHVVCPFSSQVTARRGRASAAPRWTVLDHCASLEPRVTSSEMTEFPCSTKPNKKNIKKNGTKRCGSDVGFKNLWVPHALFQPSPGWHDQRFFFRIPTIPKPSNLWPPGCPERWWCFWGRSIQPTWKWFNSKWLVQSHQLLAIHGLQQLTENVAIYLLLGNVDLDVGSKISHMKNW